MRTCAKSFKNFDCMDCEIITFEVEEKLIYLVPRKDNKL
jgi:hypothetical protein